MQPLLRLRGISKSYGTVAANAAIDLDVMPHSIHAILGENGAGKSTLMKLIYGVETPDEGGMEWQAKPVSPGSPAEARGLGIGMVFQHFSLFETLTVTENISLIVPGRKAALAQRIRSLGAQYGLEVNPNALVHSLSVGERQRVEILRCLMLEPKLLILDEPTSVLAPQSVELLFETLRKLRDGGVSILFISHKLEEIRALCDRATILRAGRVAGEVDPRAHSANALATLMIGRAMPAPLPAKAMPEGKVMLDIAGLSYPSDDPFGVSLSLPSLQVRAGEIVGIAGVSGNGQTELAALISGETSLTADKRDVVRILGRPVGRMGAAARRKLGFAFVPEDRLGRGAVPEMSLADNSLLTAHRRGLVRRGLINRRKEADFTRRCMADFDVRASGPKAEAGSLSGGNLQKFIMGREIMLDPDLIFVAQPTWGVDIGASAQIRQRLIAMRNAGKAVLVVSEELEELFEICDRLHVLHHGRLSPSLPLPQTTVEEVGEWMIGAKETAHAG
ncbi:ABC transporter ATP-binding protein [Paracoccus sp. MBLB3053]|uniref:ABC transporter ATP-binding protein n=1 Tax=Paracoccus aurantius TaxID=3073814 RepID=A0ABU2HS33_9RHOB|nr:ABC transporter ATP-binding protein [Paracoccus sp. MBLB3053]MDS9467861.1 ABC transporter ATP-binding protein [Paracoccus sp. MBLB3053]